MRVINRRSASPAGCAVANSVRTSLARVYKRTAGTQERLNVCIISGVDISLALTVSQDVQRITNFIILLLLVNYDPQ